MSGITDWNGHLKRRAQYALNSKSKNLVYETFGAAKMARNLDAITHDQFMELNRMLVTEGLNDPKAGLE